ncbi:MAG TPA: hypothetical protein VEX68_29155 [Bryobacteraceae bacterium]|nr:hypothetical protein [Bryobacteraceae bacterium]
MDRTRNTPKLPFSNLGLMSMSKQEKLITNDENTTAVDNSGAQTSNKTGLKSSSRKPSNTGPDAHQEHAAPVSGAFGNEENREDQRGTFAPADKAIKNNRDS